jgi:hypothetical protein
MLQKLNVSLDNPIGVLNEFKTQMTQDYIRYNDWRISKSKLGNHLVLEKAFYRTNIFSDSVRFIEKYFDKIYNREFTSILCGGLGLGVAPFMSQTFCDVIDVVEIDVDLIRLVDTAEYLDPKVNIIHGDFFTYKPQQTYDVILVDIWQDELGDFEKEVNIIMERYAPYINDDGLLYFPLVNLLEKDKAPCNC